MNFVVFVLILTSELPVPSPLPSFILNLTTATHCTLYYNLPQSHIKKLQNIKISLARVVTRMPKSSHITPVLTFLLHWLKRNERSKYKLLSLTYKVLTTSISPRLDFCSTCHNTRSSSMVAHLLSPFWKSQIVLLGMLHFVYWMNSPLISASQTQSPALSPITHGSSSS